MLISLEALAMAGVDHTQYNIDSEEQESDESETPPSYLLADGEDEDFNQIKIKPTNDESVIMGCFSDSSSSCLWDDTSSLCSSSTQSDDEEYDDEASMANCLTTAGSAGIVVDLLGKVIIDRPKVAAAHEDDTDSIHKKVTKDDKKKTTANAVNQRDGRMTKHTLNLNLIFILAEHRIDGSNSTCGGVYGLSQQQFHGKL